MQLIATFAAAPNFKTAFEVNERSRANDRVAKTRSLGNLTSTQFLRTA